jgi:aspartate aminotransferase
MDHQPISRRVTTIAAAKPFGLLFDYINDFNFAERRLQPGTLDFTVGDPHEMPSRAYVEALAAGLEPQNELWFAYKQNEPAAREAAAAGLRRAVGLPFETEDIHLTTGGFAAIALAMKVVADPGDEVIYSLPPWFLYEALALEAGLVPVKVGIDQGTFDLDIEAIAAAITPKTRIVIVCTPNNPTGRIYPPETLERLAAVLDEASERNGQRIYLLSDEPYQRIVYDGASPVSPLRFYPHSFLAYSYGKTLLAPGQRMGYLAVPPTMPDRPALRDAIQTLQIATGWVYPNAVLQHALPRLEELQFDIALFQRKRDRMVAALREIGYRVTVPEGAFYLFPESPLADDAAFATILAELGVLVLPGRMFETPGYFRISLTATLETIEAGLPRFAEAYVRATSAVPA